MNHHSQSQEIPNLDLRSAQSRALGFAFVLNLIFFGVELIGGFATQSLALLSDAAHMFSDVFALGLSFFALKLAAKAKDASKTYGYARAEVLAALINTVILWVLAIGLVFEALVRLREPSVVATLPMTAIAGLGLFANVLSVLGLRPHAHHSHGHPHDHENHDHDHHSETTNHHHTPGNINLRAAYLHLMMDILGSVIALIAGVAMYFTGLWVIDSIASLVILALTVTSSWGLLKESIGILMESTPKNISLSAVLSDLKAFPDIKEVHDLHIWHLTPSEGALLTTHLVLKKALPQDHYQSFLKSVKNHLRDRFHIKHSTIQIEFEAALKEEDCSSCG